MRAVTDLGSGGIRRKKTKLKDRAETQSEDRAATVLLPRGTGNDLAPQKIGAAKPMSLERRRNNLPCVFLLLW